MGNHARPLEISSRFIKYAKASPVHSGEASLLGDDDEGAIFVLESIKTKNLEEMVKPYARL